MRLRVFFCAVVALVVLVSCGKSKQQIETENRQLAANLKLEAEKKEAAETALKQEAERKAAEEAENQAKAEKKALEEKFEKYRQPLLNILKDAGSAQFRSEHLTTGDGGEALCGEVNARNSFGGYTGFTAFVVTERKMQYASSNVVLLSANDDWLIAESNKVHLRSAGCSKP